MLILLSGWLIAALVSTQDADQHARPECLVQSELARDSIRTANVEWSVSYPTSSHDRRASTYFRNWKYAFGKYCQEFTGDEEGVVARDELGNPSSQGGARSSRVMFHQGNIWECGDRDIEARVWDPSNADQHKIVDLRLLGLNPILPYSDIDSMVKNAGYPPLAYTTTETNNVYHVIAKTDESEIQWWIDAGRGWSVTRAMVRQGDQTVSEVEFEVAQFDGIWFPSRMRRYSGAKGEDNISEEIKIIAAEFNRDDHPQEITPKSIGLEIGMPVRFIDVSPPFSSPVWNGEDVVPAAQFSAAVDAGLARISPTLLRERARLIERIRREEARAAEPAEDAQIKSRLTRWEQYTRDVCAHYALSSEQAQHAWNICRACQEQARSYAARHARALDGSTTAVNPDAAVQLFQRIDSIFETRLKPRLEDIPTTSQRAAAKNRNHPATQPATLKK